MIIDPIINQMPKRTSVIGIVVLALIGITAPIATYLICKRMGAIDYGRVGRPIVNGSATIKASVWWSLVIFIYSICVFGSMFGDYDLGFFECAYLFLISLSMFITALGMFCYGAVYSEEIVTKSDMLILQAQKYGFINANEHLVEGKVKIHFGEINKYIKSFERYGVIEFKDYQNGIYTVSSFHPLIEEYFAIQEMSEPPEVPFAVSKWMCQGCGAPNTSKVCEYCGRSKV